MKKIVSAISTPRLMQSIPFQSRRKRAKIPPMIAIAKALDNCDKKRPANSSVEVTRQCFPFCSSERIAGNSNATLRVCAQMKWLAKLGAMTRSVVAKRASRELVNNFRARK